MSRNVQVLLIVSLLFGSAAGIYEFVLPYYLDSRSISFKNMGYIFSISTAAMFFVRLSLGGLADLCQHKTLYMLAVIGGALSTFFTPLSATIFVLIFLKTARDVSGLMRDTVHPILLYEDNRGRFLDSIGKTRGLEFLFQAFGTLVAGLGLTALSAGKTLWLSVAALALAVAILALGLKTPKESPARSRALKKQAFLSWDLAPNLKVIMFASFIFSMGLSTSHCFIMPLFFAQKFSASASAVSVVMIIHRLTLALPMLFIGNLKLKNPKAIYIGSVILQGASISLSALLPNFILASSVWLVHDLVGAGVWQPIQSMIIQDACRDSSRGLDLSKTLAFSALGGAIGPLLAGYLSPTSISAPFFASGVLIMLSALWLFRLS